MKVSELEGALLDAAVAKALGGTLRTSRPWEIHDDGSSEILLCIVDGKPINGFAGDGWAPSTRWEHGGPIIERERIAVYWDHCPAWIAGFDLGIDRWDYGGETGSGACLDMAHGMRGPTPLIAAMRAYVASRFGDEVELP